MPQLAVLCVPFRLVAEDLAVWLSASADRWSLPKAMLGEHESHEECLRRLIASLPFSRDVVRRVQCGVRSDPRRAMGEREVALVAWATVRAGSQRAAERAVDASGDWHPADRLPDLIDDHAATIGAALADLGREILGDPVTRRVLPRHLLRSRSDALVEATAAVEWQPALFGLLPDPFPLSAIRRFYERLLEAPIDRGNFRRKLAEIRPTGMIKELPLFQRGVRHRAAQLFTFDARAWERWVASGADANGSDGTASNPESASGPATLASRSAAVAANVNASPNAD